MKQLVWFHRWGWLYWPVSTAGWLTVLGATAFCAQVLVAVDRQSHSASDTLYGAFPYLACCFLLLDWLAARTSAAPRDRQP
jgi:hypothetical protein